MKEAVNPTIPGLNVFKQISDFNWDAITYADLEGKLIYTNQAANELYGYEAGELIGQSVDVFNAQVSHNTDQIVEAIKEHGGWSGEIIQRKKDNTHFTAQLTVFLVKDDNGQPIGLASNSKDITEKKRIENQLSVNLEERNVLLNEIHHRVKNNLAIISSLLQLQIFSSDSEEVLRVLVSSQSRIKSASIIHELLYENECLSQVQMHGYVEKLVIDIANTFNQVATQVDIQHKIDPKIEVEVKQALPIGLIINELIVNAFKHAFHGIDNGRINIVMTQNNHAIELVVEDNGAGSTHDLNSNLGSKIGYSLIHTLNRQLMANMSVRSESGVKVLISIPIKQ